MLRSFLIAVLVISLSLVIYSPFAVFSAKEKPVFSVIVYNYHTVSYFACDTYRINGYNIKAGDTFTFQVASTTTFSVNGLSNGIHAEINNNQITLTFDNPHKELQFLLVIVGKRNT